MSRRYERCPYGPRRHFAPELLGMLTDSAAHQYYRVRHRRTSLGTRQRYVKQRYAHDARARKFRLLLLLKDCPSAAKPARQKGAASQDVVEGQTAPRSAPIVNLPVEIQLMVLDLLDFLDIRSLRRSCRYFHHLYSPELVCKRFGGPTAFRRMLDRYCRICLYSPTWRANIPIIDCNEVFRAVCWHCEPGSTYCKWCGYDIPISEQETLRDIHIDCFRLYHRTVWLFFLLGITQFVLTIGGVVLAWRYFRGARAVVGPVTANLIMTVPRYCFIQFRHQREWEYHHSLRIEVIMSILWIPPASYVSYSVSSTGYETSSIVCLVVLWVNFVFYVINAVGYWSLYLGNVIRNHYLPDRGLGWRFVDVLVFLSICWAYPQSIEVDNQPPSHASFLGCLGRFPKCIYRIR